MKFIRAPVAADATQVLWPRPDVGGLKYRS